MINGTQCQIVLGSDLGVIGVDVGVGEGIDATAFGVSRGDFGDANGDADG